MPDDPNTTIIDGETVETADEQTSLDLPEQTVGDGQIMINMEGMIKNLIEANETLELELKKNKDMLNDIFENDPTFKDHSEKAKEATKQKQATKQQILKQPQAAQLNGKVKEIASAIKENRDSLSDYLREYQRMSGITEIEDNQGNLREIIFVAKLIRK